MKAPEAQMSERKVKGVILQRSWVQLRELLDEGRLKRDVLEVQLEPEDLAILDGKVEPSLWYPIGTVSRFSKVLSMVSGGDGPSTWSERGREVMRDILQAPTFARFVDGALGHSEEQAGTTLMGMSRLLLDFGEMRFDGGFERFEVTLSDVAGLPDLIRYAIEGAIEGLAEHVLKTPVEITSRAVDGSTIVYRRVDPAAA